MSFDAEPSYRRSEKSEIRMENELRRFGNICSSLFCVRNHAVGRESKEDEMIDNKWLSGQGPFLVGS